MDFTAPPSNVWKFQAIPDAFEIFEFRVVVRGNARGTIVIRKKKKKNLRNIRRSRGIVRSACSRLSRNVLSRLCGSPNIKHCDVTPRVGTHKTRFSPRQVTTILSWWTNTDETGRDFFVKREKVFNWPRVQRRLTRVGKSWRVARIVRIVIIL